jgi:hypothetical protein
MNREKKLFSFLFFALILFSFFSYASRGGKGVKYRKVKSKNGGKHFSGKKKRVFGSQSRKVKKTRSAFRTKRKKRSKTSANFLRGMKTPVFDQEEENEIKSESVTQSHSDQISKNDKGSQKKDYIFDKRVDRERENVSQLPQKSDTQEKKGEEKTSKKESLEKEEYLPVQDMLKTKKVDMSIEKRGETKNTPQKAIPQKKACESSEDCSEKKPLKIISDNNKIEVQGKIIQAEKQKRNEEEENFKKLRREEEKKREEREQVIKRVEKEEYNKREQEKQEIREREEKIREEKRKKAEQEAEDIRKAEKQSLQTKKEEDEKRKKLEEKQFEEALKNSTKTAQEERERNVLQEQELLKKALEESKREAQEQDRKNEEDINKATELSKIEQKKIQDKEKKIEKELGDYKEKFVLIQGKIDNLFGHNKNKDILKDFIAIEKEFISLEHNFNTFLEKNNVSSLSEKKQLQVVEVHTLVTALKNYIALIQEQLEASKSTSQDSDKTSPFLPFHKVKKELPGIKNRYDEYLADFKIRLTNKGIPDIDTLTIQIESVQEITKEVKVNFLQGLKNIENKFDEYRKKLFKEIKEEIQNLEKKENKGHKKDYYEKYLLFLEVNSDQYMLFQQAVVAFVRGEIDKVTKELEKRLDA